MENNINVDQVKLIEIFSSLGYFTDLRDIWTRMVEHVESQLEHYMANLPPRYRSNALPEQPDIVWGHRVIPNFRHTVDALNEGFIALTHGDMGGLSAANGPRSDAKGQLDYWTGWMDEKADALYQDLLYAAADMANNIVLTEGAYWQSIDPLKHTKVFEKYSGDLNQRNYKINREISVRSGEKTKISGIYIPDVPQCCPQFLSDRYKSAPSTSVCIGTEDLFDPVTGEKYDETKIFEKLECTWYLIEKFDRTELENIDSLSDSANLTVIGGQRCPRDGFYFTPAKLNSRVFYKKGETMPVVDATYGKTIWQWDQSQK